MVADALLYPRLEAYIRPLGNMGVFYLFPTVAYVFIGTFVGAVIAAPREPAAERRFHMLLGIAGVAIWLAGWAGSYLPPISGQSDFYTTSLSLIVIRVGVMTAALAVAWLWMRRPTAGHWSPLVLFGRTSLFVYLVHVPLAYGAFSSPIHHALSLPAALAAYAMLTAIMLALAAWWNRAAENWTGFRRGSEPTGSGIGDRQSKNRKSANRLSRRFGWSRSPDMRKPPILD